MADTYVFEVNIIFTLYHSPTFATYFITPPQFIISEATVTSPVEKRQRKLSEKISFTSEKILLTTKKITNFKGQVLSDITHKYNS